jgi:hypothetical protein
MTGFYNFNIRKMNNLTIFYQFINIFFDKNVLIIVTLSTLCFFTYKTIKYLVFFNESFEQFLQEILFFAILNI